MAMATKEYEKARGNYLALMQIIDEYRNDEAPPSNGLLYFLKGVVPQLVISKYGRRPRMEDFKEFFCNRVLQLNKSKKRSFCEYENYFNHGNADGYSFTPEFMNACMEDEELLKNGIPKILLNRLWQMSHEYLREYFALRGGGELSEETKNELEALDDAKHYIGTEKERQQKVKETELSEDAKEELVAWEETEERKREAYCCFVKATALYEIFVLKFLSDTSLEQIVEKSAEFQTGLEELQTLGILLSESGAAVSGVEIETMKHKMDNFIKNWDSMMEEMKEITRGIVYYWHIKYLSVFSMIITLIEFNNVAKCSNSKLGRTEITDAIKEALEKETKFIYMDGVKMNKDKRYTLVYQQMVEIAEQNRIIKELCNSSSKVHNRVLEQIKAYFYNVKKGTYQCEDGKEDEDFAKVVMQIAEKCAEETF